LYGWAVCEDKPILRRKVWGKVLCSILPCETACWPESLTTLGLLPGMESLRVFW